MSARAHTIWSSREVYTFLRAARRVYTSLAFDIRIAPKSQTAGRILIVTPKKMGSAPQRNRFRRRLKAIFHENNLAARGLDIAIFAKAPANNLSFAELQTIVLKLYQEKSPLEQIPCQPSETSPH